jgi:hypothetical protein
MMMSSAQGRNEARRRPDCMRNACVNLMLDGGQCVYDEDEDNEVA